MESSREVKAVGGTGSSSIIPEQEAEGLDEDVFQNVSRPLSHVSDLTSTRILEVTKN